MFKSFTLTTLVMSAALSFSQSVYSASLLPGDVLVLDTGVGIFNPGGGLPVGVSSGSYFAADLNGDGAISAQGEFQLMSNGTVGLKIGTLTPAGASHAGAPLPGDTNSVDAPFNFFSNTGSHQLTAHIFGDTDNGLNFTGWTWNWNGQSVNMWNGAWTPTNCGALGCLGSFTDGIANFDWSGLYGDNFVLDYTATIPIGDPSGLGGIQFFWHLEGIVEEGTVVDPIPVPAAVWLFGSGLLGLIGVARRGK